MSYFSKLGGALTAILCAAACCSPPRPLPVPVGRDYWQEVSADCHLFLLSRVRDSRDYALIASQEGKHETLETLQAWVSQATTSKPNLDKLQWKEIAKRRGEPEPEEKRVVAAFVQEARKLMESSGGS